MTCLKSLSGFRDHLRTKDQESGHLAVLRLICTQHSLRKAQTSKKYCFWTRFGEKEAAYSLHVVGIKLPLGNKKKSDVIF